MKRLTRLAFTALVFLAGYCLGMFGPLQDSSLRAYDGPSDEASNSVRQALQALSSARSSLETDQRYASATDGVNAFAVLSGGIDAISDLESGRGVDPETFAALYAGRALRELQPDLGWDEQGRLTFRGDVVRMYSKSRLARLFAERDRLAIGALTR